MRTGAALAVTAIVAVAMQATAPHANADDAALNGRYLATSNGDWAMTTDVYRDLPSVRSTWTIAMTCTDAVNCTGTVTSDAGWSADIVTTNGEYIVKRDLPAWQHCADGTGRTVTGHQSYRFFPVGDDGFLLPGSRVFAGFDKTGGESGACSLNEMTEIEMPFRLDKLD
ncbi:hypothetical protein [Mycolicibacterium celeriflavum]|uniref:hypothetical protein n=1 Tax=Mycolicibacterium celeriflavum TaxID=1249101 RepID=UPI003CEE453A